MSRVWLILAIGSVAIVGIVARWRTARPAERLLALWMLVGFAELMVHDSTNERRYVMFIPPLVALTSLWIAGAAKAETLGEERAEAGEMARREEAEREAQHP